MLNTSDHPGDEILAALAGGDLEPAEAPIADHVASCARCSAIRAELSGLLAAMAQLPDVAPPRPLRLLPPEADASPRPDGPGPWIRRFFGPVMAGGAALALIGMVGTAAPALSGSASTADQQEMGAMAPGASILPESGEAGGPAALSSPAIRDTGNGHEAGAHATPPADGGTFSGPLAERSLWPMFLFTGMALMIAAALLRWILAPRAP